MVAHNSHALHLIQSQHTAEGDSWQAAGRHSCNWLLLTITYKYLIRLCTYGHSAYSTAYAFSKTKHTFQLGTRGYGGIGSA